MNKTDSKQELLIFLLLFSFSILLKVWLVKDFFFSIDLSIQRDFDILFHPLAEIRSFSGYWLARQNFKIYDVAPIRDLLF
jgi:hypothetical protein